MKRSMSWRWLNRSSPIIGRTRRERPLSATGPSQPGMGTPRPTVRQMRPDVWPVLTQVALGLFDGHPIHARAALVAANPFPRSFEISSVAHLLHQLFRASRAFGCWFRHEWFGPLVTVNRGFTPAFRYQGQRVLDLLPLSTHELPVLLATLNRSGLQSSFRLGLSVAPPFGLGVPH
jgi:hypothetical protein